MTESWQDIEKRALADWKFMDTLENGEKQMLYAFLSFCPPLANQKHLVIRTTKSAVHLLLQIINQPGGVWHDPTRIPFDDNGRCYVEHELDDTLFPEHFKLWATSKNQEVVFDFAERKFDEQSFAAIFPADTPPEIVGQIDQLDPSRYKECLDAFFRLLPKLRWALIMLKPTGKFGIFLVDEEHRELLSQVTERLPSESVVHFELTKADERYFWRGPTEWD